jgi:hypothetical protein
MTQIYRLTNLRLRIVTSMYRSRLRYQGESVTEPTPTSAPPSVTKQRDPLQVYGASGLALVLISAAAISISRSVSPVVLKVQDLDGVDGLYGTGGAEYFGIAVGAVIGLVGLALIAVAAIAKGIQLGRG